MQIHLYRFQRLVKKLLFAFVQLTRRTGTVLRSWSQIIKVVLFTVMHHVILVSFFFSETQCTQITVIQCQGEKTNTQTKKTISV